MYSKTNVHYSDYPALYVFMSGSCYFIYFDSLIFLLRSHAAFDLLKAPM